MSDTKKGSGTDESLTQTDMFGDLMDPLPEPAITRVGSPEEIMEMIKNGKVAQTREEFLGIPSSSAAKAVDETELRHHTHDFRPADPRTHQPQGDQPQALTEVQPVDPGKQFAFGNQPTREIPSTSTRTPQADQSFQVPKLPVTDSDIIRFLSCIKEGKYYSETFTKADYSVTFRVKSAAEIAWIRACLSRMIYDTGEVRTLEDMNQAILRFNLLLQTVSIGNRTLKNVAVPGTPPWSEDNLNLEKLFWASEFSTMPETTLFLIQSLMVQFETKVRDIEVSLIDPKFSSEGGHS